MGSEKHCLDLLYNNKQRQMKDMLTVFRQMWKEDPKEMVLTALTAVAIFAFGYLLLVLAAILS